MKKTILFLGVIFTIFSTGCGNSGISEDNAGMLAGSLSAMIEASASSLGDPDSATGSSPLSFLKSKPARLMGLDIEKITRDQLSTFACGDVSGDSTDADSDTAPVNVTNTFTDCELLGITISGSTNVKDDDDSNALSGFDVTFTDFTTTFESDSFSFSSEIDMVFDLATVIDGSTITSMTVDYTFDFKMTYGDDDLVFTSTSDIAYTPSTPISAFGDSQSGAYSLTGNFNFKWNGDSISLSVSTSGLQYTSAGCFGGVAGFTEGTITAKDSDDNSVVVTYSSDCSATSKFNGTTVTPVS